MKNCPRLWAAERQVDGRKQWAREASGTPAVAIFAFAGEYCCRWRSEGGFVDGLVQREADGLA
jgi:hypothetical protein